MMLLFQCVTERGDHIGVNILITEEQQLLDHYGIEDGSLCYVDSDFIQPYAAWLSNWDYSGAEKHYFKIARVDVDLTGE